jgi:hypothetical protein
MTRPAWPVPALVFALATALAYVISSGARRRRERRFIEEKVNQWEDEGGRIPGATPSAETITETP